jgi:hypothetical protein
MIDHDAWIESMAVGSWYLIDLTYSQKQGLALWLQRNKKDLKLNSRQMHHTFEVNHSDTRTYALCLSKRTPT